MKVCKKCKVAKGYKEYSKYSGGSSSYRLICKACRRLRGKDMKRALRIEAYKYFGERCKDCKVKSSKDNYTIFDFHHLDPSKKDLKFANNGYGAKRFWNEIKKCVMLCSNCHRIRHFNERRLAHPERYQ